MPDEPVVAQVEEALAHWDESGVPRNRAMELLAALVAEVKAAEERVALLEGDHALKAAQREEWRQRAESAESRERELRAALEQSARAYHTLAAHAGTNHHGVFTDCNLHECVRARAALTQEKNDG